MSNLLVPSVGYAGSERSGCVLSIYRRGRQGLSFFSQGLGPGLSTSLAVDGTDRISGARLVGVGTSNAIGSGGQWQATIMARPGSDWDVYAHLEVDSWVDISLVRHGVAWHVMRGVMTDIRVQESAAGGGGATVKTISIGGTSFQRVWQTTLWWFSSLLGENLGNSAVIRSVGVDRLIGYPNVNVHNILFEFFRTIGATGRANWELPASMPGCLKDAADTIAWDDTGFDAKFDRRFSPSAASVYPNTDLWSMAQQYQDGMFCELFTDILPPGGVAAYALEPEMRGGLSPVHSDMTAVFRDKPFPVATRGAASRSGLNSAYFSLPTHTVRRAQVQSLSLGVSSQEAFNSFSFSSHFGQEQLRSFIECQYCLWNPSQMSRRGMRKLDASTMYMNDNLIALFKQKRNLLRDWYCLGHELLQGTVDLGRGFPEIRVGSRLCIVGPQPEDRLTLYIEGVRHTCQPNGMKTSLDVTRGYAGTDAAHLQRLNQELLDYSLSS